MNLFQRFYDTIRGIPPGCVLSYGQVAALTGNPRMARQVGWALHACRPEDEVPWHRVVTREGRLVPGGEEEQRRLLEAEGVSFTPQGRVELRHFLLPPGRS